MNFKLSVPKSERPREKALLYGIDKLTNYELLAIIINSGVKNKNVLQISQDLINHFGGLNFLATQNYTELVKISGLNKIKALNICAVFELSKRINSLEYKEKYDKSNIEILLKKFQILILENNNENLFILFLNEQNYVIHTEKFEGYSNSIGLDLTNLFSKLLKFDIKKFIIIHNHVNNILEPSYEDLNFYNNLKTRSDFLKLKIQDFIIINKKEYFSFRENLLI